MLDSGRALSTQPIMLETFLQTDSYGTPSYAAAVRYRGRVSGKVELLRSADGQELIAVTKVYLPGVPTVSVKDRITLPDGTQPPVLAVNTVPDATGRTHHTVLHVGGRPHRGG